MINKNVSGLESENKRGRGGLGNKGKKGFSSEHEVSKDTLSFFFLIPVDHLSCLCRRTVNWKTEKLVLLFTSFPPALQVCQPNFPMGAFSLDRSLPE